MSWFDATNFTSLAKSALKEAQKTLDRALDIEVDDENDGSASTTIADVKSNKSVSPGTKKSHVVSKDSSPKKKSSSSELSNEWIQGSIDRRSPSPILSPPSILQNKVEADAQSFCSSSPTPPQIESIEEVSTIGTSLSQDHLPLNSSLVKADISSSAIADPSERVKSEESSYGESWGEVSVSEMSTSVGVEILEMESSSETTLVASSDDPQLIVDGGENSSEVDVSILESAMMLSKVESVKEREGTSGGGGRESSESVSPVVVGWTASSGSGHTSADEVEEGTATSSDIEVISRCSPNDYTTVQCHQQSPVKVIESRRSKGLNGGGEGRSSQVKRGHRRESSEASSDWSEEYHSPDIQLLNKKILDLTELLEIREKKVGDLAKINSELQDTNNQLTTELQETKKHIMKENEKTSRQMTDKNRIKNLTEKVENLEKQLSVQQSAERRVQEENNELGRKISQLNLDLSRTLQLLEETNFKSDQLRLLLAEAQKKEKEAREEKKQLQRRLQMSDAKHEELTHAASSATKPLLRQLDQLQAHVNSQKEAWELRERQLLEQLEKASNRSLHDAQLKGLQGKVSSLEVQLAEKSDSLTQIQVDNETLKSQVTLLNHELAQLKEQHLIEVRTIEKIIQEKEKELSVEKESHVADRSELEKLRLQMEQQQELRHAHGELHINIPSNSKMDDCCSLNHSPTPSLLSELPDELFERGSTGSRAMYESMRINESILGGGNSAVLESLQSQLKMREGEVSQLQWEVHRRDEERSALTNELTRMASLLAERDETLAETRIGQAKLEQIRSNYDALLQMYGEKVEEVEELRMDLVDVKEMYKDQIDQLLARSKLEIDRDLAT